MAHNKVSSLLACNRKYPDDPTREVFEAAKSGDAVLLSEVLQQMNSSERASALETKMDVFIDHIGSSDTTKVTPLIMSVQNENLDCVKVLLNYKADIEGRSDHHSNQISAYPPQYPCRCFTPLCFAVARGNLDVLSCLVENGADVNARMDDMYTGTPLMIASRNGNVNVVTLLIEHGANVDLDIEDKHGKTALHYAVEHCRDSCDVLSVLIKNGADVNGQRNYNCTPLMIASRKGDVNVVNFLIEHGANADLQSKYGKTALLYAVENYHGSFNVLNCLIENGADVNARTNDTCTPLMIASENGDVNVVTFLIEHGANVDLEDEYGETALHHAVDCCHNSCNVLSCLIKNGANVNSLTNENRTPLMVASCRDYVNMVLFLVEHGADIDLQDIDGNTALHNAVRYNSSEVVHRLLSLGASQLYNNQGLTPLLSASKTCKISILEDLITRPELTKEQRIDAQELLGASLVTQKRFYASDTVKGFQYMKYGMEERFADPSYPLLKQPMDLVEAYQYRKESQTLEELAWIEGDTDAIIMEGLIIRERILETDNSELLDPIRYVADYFENRDLPTCIRLRRHAIRVAQSCNKSAFIDLFQVTSLLLEMFSKNDPPREEVLLELLEQTVLEYEKQQDLRPGLRISHLIDSTMNLVQMIAKLKYCEKCKTSLVLLKRLCGLHVDPRSLYGNTLLHKAVNNAYRLNSASAFSCIDTVKLLLNAGFNVNAVNNNGDTPLHRAVTFVPRRRIDRSHLLTDMLKVLLDGGAHHDFVNNDGKTAMDMAKTDEARMILCEKRKLELKCISARAVKKFGLPYLGIVPKILENYISRH